MEQAGKAHGAARAAKTPAKEVRPKPEPQHAAKSAAKPAMKSPAKPAAKAPATKKKAAAKRTPKK
jgi:hypothetical protein